MRPRILAWRNDWSGLGPRGTDLMGGVGYYRIHKPLQFLHDRYDIFEFGDFLSCLNSLRSLGESWSGDEMIPNLIRDCDLIYMKHVTHPGGLAWFAGAAEYYNKPLLVDMDDNYLAVDDLNPRREYFKEGQTAKIVLEQLWRSATALTVSTEPLVKVYEQFNPNVHVLENYNDTADWAYTKGQRADGRIVIGWAGSLTHEADLEVFVPVIEKLWAKYGEKIIFSFCGGWPEKLLKELPQGSSEMKSGTRTMRDYHGRLANWGFDIGVAPLKESAFNEGKSHGKWMEYAMYRIPTVASNVGPYQRVIEDGVTGLLANTTDEWVDKISRLIDNPSVRQQLGQAAYEKVQTSWQWQNHANTWATVFDQYIGKGFSK